MKCDKLKDILEKARDDGIIECDEIESLKCPYVNKPLVRGWCEYRLSGNLNCNRGVGYGCSHRLDVFYDGAPQGGVMLIVRYRHSLDERTGFIPDSNWQLKKILDWIESCAS
jgi:hypothetical protein